MKKIIIAIATFIFGLSAVAQPVLATSVPQTFADDSHYAILKGCGEAAESSGEKGVICVLKIVINIMTIGVGILGAIGITISGIQYLTAGGNEEQTRKAKRRIFEIVIGLAAFVLMNLLLNWLLPDFDAANI